MSEHEKRCRCSDDGTLQAIIDDLSSRPNLQARELKRLAAARKELNRRKGNRR